MANVPTIQFTSTGLVLPSESELLTGTFADIDDAFGGGVKQSLKTPQGQLATSLAKIIADKNEQIAYIANQVDPDYSAGLWQDAIGAIYFLSRKVALPTTVACDCVGEVGKVIAAGSKASDLSGNVYVCVDGGEIPSGGAISLNFQNIVTGAIPCPANSLVYIYQADSGWDTINNPTDGVLGRAVESRADFEYRRRNSVALMAHGTLESIYSAVANLDSVLDVYCFENDTDTVITAGSTSYSLVKNSIYVAVIGGSDADIGAAILEKKGAGCNMNGNTSVVIPDDENYAYPYPTYTIKFHRPTPYALKFYVSIVDNTSLPSNIEGLIKAAIISAFTGEDGGQRARIGSTVFASRYYGPVALTSPFVSIIEILLGHTTATLNQFTFGVDQQPTISSSDIVVAKI